MKKILIIGKVWPEAKSSAAGTRMMQLIHFFLRQKCEVIFVSTAKQSGFEENLEELGVETHSIILNDASFDIFLKKADPSHIVYDRFMTEEQFGWRVRNVLPKCIDILNTEDLHFLRDARKEGYKKELTVDERKIRTPLLYRELGAILRCDKTLLVSDFEEKLLINYYEVDKEKLIYYPVLIDTVLDNTPNFDERKDLLFIGNFYHEPNWDSLLYLKIKIWPILRKELPNVNLHIYGAYPSEKVLNLHNPKENFLVHGRIMDALDATKKVRLCLAPLVYGAGIKGKILEAITCGTPFVTNNIGAEGMLDEKFTNQIAVDTESFAKKCVHLYQNKDSWIAARHLGQEIAEKKFKASLYEKEFKARFLDYKRAENHNLMLNTLNFHSNKHYTYLSKWIESKKGSK